MKFYKKFFLIANINLKIILKLSIFILNNVDVNFLS